MQTKCGGSRRLFIDLSVVLYRYNILSRKDRFLQVADKDDCRAGSIGRFSGLVISSLEPVDSEQEWRYGMLQFCRPWENDGGWRVTMTGLQTSRVMNSWRQPLCISIDIMVMFCFIPKLVMNCLNCYAQGHPGSSTWMLKSAVTISCLLQVTKFEVRNADSGINAEDGGQDPQVCSWQRMWSIPNSRYLHADLFRGRLWSCCTSDQEVSRSEL